MTTAKLSICFILFGAFMFVVLADVPLPGDHSMTATQIANIVNGVNNYRKGLVSKTVKLNAGKYPYALKPLFWDEDLYAKMKNSMATTCEMYTEGGTSSSMWYKWYSSFTKVQDYDLYTIFLGSRLTAEKVAPMNPDVYTGALHEKLASHYTYALACASSYCNDGSDNWLQFACTIRSDIYKAPIFMTAPYSSTNKPVPPEGDWTLLEAQKSVAELVSGNVVPVSPLVATSTSQAYKNLQQYAQIRLPASDRKVALDYHNLARKQFRLGKLQRNDGTFWPASTQPIPNLNWSEYAEALALGWAYGRTFSAGHNPNGLMDGYDHGENICDPGIQGGSCTTALKMCTAMFYLEGMCASSAPLSIKDKFDSTNRDYSCVSHIGHFTQVVWSKTTHVGCACTPGFLVCNYYPPGNWIGEAIYK